MNDHHPHADTIPPDQALLVHFSTPMSSHPDLLFPENIRIAFSSRARVAGSGKAVIRYFAARLSANDEPWRDLVD
jgi:hypothetical protein